MTAKNIIENSMKDLLARSHDRIASAMKDLLARISPAAAKVGFSGIHTDAPYVRSRQTLWVGPNPEPYECPLELSIETHHKSSLDPYGDEPSGWCGLISWNDGKVVHGENERSWVRADLDELVELMATRFIDMIQRRYSNGPDNPKEREIVKHGFEDTDAYLELALSEAKLMVGRVNAAFPRRKKLMVAHSPGTVLRPGQLFPGTIIIGTPARRHALFGFGYGFLDYIEADVFPWRIFSPSRFGRDDNRYVSTHPLRKKIDNTLSPSEQIYDAITFIETGLMGGKPEER